MLFLIRSQYQLFALTGVLQMTSKTPPSSQSIVAAAAVVNDGGLTADDDADSCVLKCVDDVGDSSLLVDGSRKSERIRQISSQGRHYHLNHFLTKQKITPPPGYSECSVCDAGTQVTSSCTRCFGKGYIARTTTPGIHNPCAWCEFKEAPHQCSKCQSIRYCSRACQKSHWYLHKNGCKLKSSTVAPVLPPIPPTSASASAPLAHEKDCETKEQKVVDEIVDTEVREVSVEEQEEEEDKRTERICIHRKKVKCHNQ